MKTLPHITSKQQALIRLLYRYRFLERSQVQILLHHKDKRRISAWLKDLREKQYVEWIYQPDDPIESTKPAIYYLGLNGIRYLKELDAYPVKELRKRYSESSRTRMFLDRSLLVAACALNMEARNADNGSVSYVHLTESDYISPDSDYSFLSQSEFVRPQLCYVKAENTPEGTIATTYLLEIFDTTTPRYMVKKKLKDYVSFLDSDEWEHGTGNDELPIVLIACPTKAELIYAKRYTHKLLEDAGLDENEDICIRFATVAQIKVEGITGRIWEDL